MIHFSCRLYRMSKDIAFRIAWSSLVNNVTGNGEYCLTFDQARAYVTKMNEQYKGEIHHWCEASPNVNPSKNTQTDSACPVYDPTWAPSPSAPSPSVSAPLPLAPWPLAPSPSASSPSEAVPFHQPQ